MDVEELPAFKLCRTQLIRSGMGTGKTKATIAFIKEHFSSKRVLFVSFRRTFTLELVAKLRSAGLPFVSYRERAGQLNDAMLVV